MAPVQLNTHSCEHCRRIAFGSHLVKLKNHGDEKGKAEPKAFLHVTFTDLKIGDERGCKLCSWILDDECISRDDAAAWGLGTSEIDSGKLKEALIQAAMWIPSFCPPSPEKTLRVVLAKEADKFEDCCLYLGSNDPLGVQFFGLWNNAAKQIVCRTRHGFQVQTDSVDPAAEYVSTRPIQKDPASAEVIKLLTSWVQTCHKDHQDSCPAPTTVFVPKRLIEVRDPSGTDCLRLRDSGDLGPSPYITLSYCWGGDQIIKSTVNQISYWRRAIPYEQLPKTLQDAVIICRHLNVRFLWIDAICIIQDDDLDRAQQIAQMPQIYRNGYLTIAAASASNAAQGFLEQRDTPNSETPAFKLPYYFQDGQQGAVTIFQHESHTSPLDTRAWTLQERLLSPRTLEFSTSQVRWICRKSRDQCGWTDGGRAQPEYYSERQDLLPNDVFNRVFEITQPLDKQSAGVDSNHNDDTAKKDWYRLVRAYTHRKLTNPTDRILAVSGLAKEYDAVLQDEYVAGLWRRTLLKELLWDVETATQTAPDAFQGPSWSWTSVNGHVDFKFQYDIDNPSDDRYTAEIVDCNISLVDHSAPFGAVREIASHLALKARLLPAFLMPPTPTGRPNETEDSVVLLKMNGEGGMTKLRIKLDTSDFRTRYPGREELMLLELESRFMGAQWQAKGLVLRCETISKVQRVTAENPKSNEKERSEERRDGSYNAGQIAVLRYQFRRYLGDQVTQWSADEVERYAREQSHELLRKDRIEVDKLEPDDQVFYRVGMFDFRASYRTEDDYKRRGGREGDWFKYCLPRVVEVM